MTLLLLAACAHVDATVHPKIDADAMPVLPSPHADLYARVSGRSPDPVVASVAAGLPWDETLSGVASAVALAELAGDTVDLCRLRWMAVTAGYPYPLLSRSEVWVDHGQLPEAILAEARARKDAPVDIGLVRARSGDKDRWVLLVGEHRGDIPAIPRVVGVGQTVTIGSGDWVVSDPLGNVRDVDGAFKADLDGEWMLSARLGGKPLATFPVYVGNPPPVKPPLQCSVTTGTLDERVSRAVEDVRAWYGFASLEHDGALDSVARARLRQRLAGDELPPVDEQLAHAGYVNVPVAGAECVAPTVEACLEKIWWTPDRRAVLVGDLAAYGVAVQQTDKDVAMVLVGAG